MDVYYDPYDFEIDTDPYPVWKRMRDEHPLYWNDKHEFFALSRYDDVRAGLLDAKTYSSAKGSLLELIKADIQMPPGVFIFEDPPDHDLHRGLLGRVFTPKRMADLEPKVREFCARSLDPLVGAGGFDFIADIGATMPMRTIGMLLGIPESDQEAIRDSIDAGLRIEEDGGRPNFDGSAYGSDSQFADYIDWRAKNPSNDLMTDLLNAEFVDGEGTRRKLSREEVLGYVTLIAGAGNETTTRLIGWAGKVLAENPDQRAELVADRSLLGPAVEELLRYEPPSPVQARYVTADVEHYGQTVPKGSAILLLNASANRDERKFANPDDFDIHRTGEQHLSFGFGIHFCLGAALARLEGRIALDEVLTRFPKWEVDWDNAKQARTSTVRGWETMPVVTA
jgi:cytochrome P450